MITDRFAFVLLLATAGVSNGLGFFWGAVRRRRAIERAKDAGWQECLDAQRLDTHITKAVAQEVMPPGPPRPELESVPRPGLARSDGACVDPGPGHSDWRDQVAAELDPDRLAAVNEVLLPPAEAGSQQDVPEPGHGAQGDPATGRLSPHETAGLGHPSPYGEGRLTAAQRRRDKHKQRGQYAPLELGHWYAEQLHGLADWQAAWHAEAAWFDEVWLPGYLGWYRAGVEPGVGLRRILEAAA